MRALLRTVVGLSGVLLALVAALRRPTPPGRNAARPPSPLPPLQDVTMTSAASPTGLDPSDWRAVARRTLAEVKDDQVVMLGAAVAFYVVLALVPGLVAAISLFGLFVDPAEVTDQLGSLAASLPGDMGGSLLEQARSVAGAGDGSLSVSFAAGLLTALWTASSGTKALMQALSIAYDEEEGRGFLRLRGTAVLLTVVLLGLFGGTIVVLTGAQALADGSSLPRWAAQALRFPVLLVGMVVVLAVFYRYGPDRADPEWRWVSIGAAGASLLWLLATGGIAFYVATFGSYNETYGALAGVVVLMLWLQVTAIVVLLGAELNAELEHQTVHDTTTGPDEPMGERGAVAADEPPVAVSS